MNMYHEKLEEYARSTKPDHYPIETSYGRARFLCAMCPDCRRIVDVLPERMVSMEEREAWLTEMDRRHLQVVARLHRSLWQEGECLCEP